MNTPDPASPREFVEFWALRYFDPNERLYTENINCPHHTKKTLTAVFKWKIGARFFAGTLERSVMPHFFSRIEEARALPPDAECFLKTFSGGGAIYRIFWLHCWHPRRFPIYDQHVHRAMAFICNGEIEELGESGDKDKIRMYVERYVPFFDKFNDAGISFDLESDGVPSRKVDRALMAFGKAISIPKHHKGA